MFVKEMRRQLLFLLAFRKSSGRWTKRQQRRCVPPSLFWRNRTFEDGIAASWLSTLHRPPSNSTRGEWRTAIGLSTWCCSDVWCRGCVLLAATGSWWDWTLSIFIDSRANGLCHFLPLISIKKFT